MLGRMRNEIRQQFIVAERDAVILNLRAEVARLKERQELLVRALIRLRDCDWIITPHDRMDAVRDIARTALEPKQEELK